MFLSLNLGNSKREGEKKKKKSGVSEILLSRSEDFETGRNKDRDGREREREREEADQIVVNILVLVVLASTPYVTAAYCCCCRFAFSNGKVLCSTASHASIHSRSEREREKWGRWSYGKRQVERRGGDPHTHTTTERPYIYP